MKLSNPMKITVFGLLLVSLGFLSVVNVPADNTVAICHFPGHDGDFVIEDNGDSCRQAEGGRILSVGRKGCEKGHGATGDCSLINIPL